MATLFGTVVTLTVLMLFNFLSWPIELVLSMRLYDSSALLQSPKEDVLPAVVEWVSPLRSLSLVSHKMLVLATMEELWRRSPLFSS